MESMCLIGGVQVANPLFFAPMAGVSLSAVRRFFRRLGVGLTHSEMISSTGLIFGGAKTLRMTEFTPEEEPIVIQLFDGDPGRLCQSAEISLRDRRCAAFSINMACPMPKVMKRGAGSKLLQTPEIAVSMVRELKKFGLPVWPKIRKVVPDGKTFRLDTFQFTEALLEAGADNVTIHGRTPAQRYEGVADREEVLKAAHLFPGKITASGDVYSFDDVKAYLDGGCIAVLAARGAVANPFMVVQALRGLGYNTPVSSDDPSVEERAELLIALANDLKALHSERVAMVLLKRFLPGFFRGKTGTTEFKRTMAVTKDWDSCYGVLQDWRLYFERGTV